MGYGEPGEEPSLWIDGNGTRAKGLHAAFRVGSRSLVHVFYDAALAAGATDHGGPGLRDHYAAGYYAAFVLDPDGINLEAVCHERE